MPQALSLAKTKMRKIALVASGFIVAAMALGVSATTSAGAMYGNGYNNYNNGGYGGYGNSYASHRSYSMYRWVYDPFLKRWVLIGFNVHRNSWELCNSYDRNSSHYNNRWGDTDGSYWYND